MSKEEEKIRDKKADELSIKIAESIFENMGKAHGLDDADRIMAFMEAVAAVVFTLESAMHCRRDLSAFFDEMKNYYKLMRKAHKDMGGKIGNLN